MISLHYYESIPLALAVGLILAVCMRAAKRAGRTEVLNNFHWLSAGDNGIHYAGEVYTIVKQREYRRLRDEQAAARTQIDGLKKINGRQMDLIRSYDKRKAEEMQAQRREYDEYLRDCEQGKGAIERALNATSLDLANVRAERDKLNATYKKLERVHGDTAADNLRLREEREKVLEIAEGNWKAEVERLTAAVDAKAKDEQRMADAYNGAIDDAIKAEKARDAAEAEVKRLQIEMANFVVRHNDLAAAARARMQKVHDMSDALHVWLLAGADGRRCPVELVADTPAVIDGTAICGADGKVHFVPEGQLG